jgi:dihydropteroate synthase
MPYKIEYITPSKAGLIAEEMERIGVTPEGIKIMLPKAEHRIFKVSGLSGAAASILKQEMLSKGGEVAVSRNAARFGDEMGEVLLIGTVAQMKKLLLKLPHQPFGLPELTRPLQEALDHIASMPPADIIKDRNFDWGKRTYLMGIINVTPDSFSGDGVYCHSQSEWIDTVTRQAGQFLADGADILDVGGESTRPGATQVPAVEEIRRVVPIIEELSKTSPLPLSVDTQKAVVAQAALKAGADIVNDIWGLQGDPDMVRVVADYGARVVVMHNKINRQYQDLMGEIIDFLAESIDIGLRHGIPLEKIWVDPGIGFGKTVDQNLQVLARLNELKALGCPVLLGTSRKSVIGLTLNQPVEERLEGTAATVTLGVAYGVDVVRVHDVRSMKRIAQMTDTIVRKRS